MTTQPSRSGPSKIRSVLLNLRVTYSLPEQIDVKHSKDTKRSHTAAKEGYFHFKSHEYEKALYWFNVALCCAPVNSPAMATAYAQRAAIYFDTGFYEFCLENIALALENGAAGKKKRTLLKLKQLCKKRQKETQDSAEIYKLPRHPRLMYDVKPKIPYAIGSLELIGDFQYGRCIITRRDLKPGDALMIEKPFAQVLQLKCVYSHCYHCGEMNFLNLQPCPKTTKVMFCSTKCAKIAWERYYKYESTVIDGLLRYIQQEHGLLAIRIVLKAITMCGDKFSKLRELLKNSEPFQNNPVSDEFENSEEAQFCALYSLETHQEDLQPDVDMAIMQDCAYVLYLLQTFSGLGEKIRKHEDFFLELILRFSRIVRTNAYGLQATLRSTQNPDPPQSNYGLGISPIAAYFSHSCYPNVVRLPGGIYYVCRPIPAGQKILISYISLDDCVAPTDRRRAILKQTYYFDCHCETCVANISAEYFELYTNLNEMPVQDLTSQLNALHNNDKNTRERAIRIVGELWSRMSSTENLTPSENTVKELVAGIQCLTLLHGQRSVDLIFKPQNRDSTTLQAIMQPEMPRKKKTFIVPIEAIKKFVYWRVTSTI